MSLFLGIDIGTSGVRTAVIDGFGTELASASVRMPAPMKIDGRPCQEAEIWWESVAACLHAQRKSLLEAGWQFDDIDAVSVDGTSGTLLLCDDELNPLTLGYLYNSANFDLEASLSPRKHRRNQWLAGRGLR